MKPAVEWPRRSAFGTSVRKRGSLGAELFSSGRTDALRGTPLDRPVDPTGAGDAFDGVFLAALARGSTHEEALRRACEAGRAVAMTAGTWPGVCERPP